jgi:hypothetical protein
MQRADLRQKTYAMCNRPIFSRVLNERFHTWHEAHIEQQPRLTWRYGVITVRRGAILLPLNVQLKCCLQWN